MHSPYKARSSVSCTDCHGPQIRSDISTGSEDSTVLPPSTPLSPAPASADEPLTLNALVRLPSSGLQLFDADDVNLECQN